MSLPAILALAIGPLLLIAVPLVLLLVRRARRVRERLAAELAVEPPLRGPEKALYRGGTRSFSKLKGNGTIVLTRRRLLFRMLIGPDVEIGLGEITGLRQAKATQRVSGGGPALLVVQTGAGEAAFSVSDRPAWEAAIAAAAPALSARAGG